MKNYWVVLLLFIFSACGAGPEDGGSDSMKQLVVREFKSPQSHQFVAREYSIETDLKSENVNLRIGCEDDDPVVWSEYNVGGNFLYKYSNSSSISLTLWFLPKIMWRESPKKYTVKIDQQPGAVGKIIIRYK